LGAYAKINIRDVINLVLKVESPLVVFALFMGSVIIFSLRSALLYNKKVM